MTINQFEIQVTPPERTNVAWYNPQTNEFRFFVNGEWRLPADFSQSGDGENSIVQKGSNAVAFGINSTAFGTSTTNAKERGITEESTNEEIIEEWENSDPESDKFALAKGEGALVEGNNCLALGKNSHAEGNGTIAGNNSSHAEGTGTKATGKYAHAEGLETQAVGERSHAEGQETIAEGKQSHAEGKHTYASANGSHTEGLLEPHVEREYFSDSIKSANTESKLYQTLDYGASEDVYAVGQILWKISEDGEVWQDVRSQNIKVTAVYGGDSKWFSLSKKLGIGNKATRYVRVITEETEHYPAQTNGEYSHVEGVNTQTNNRGEHAEGRYNKSNANTISSVGIGTAYDDRKNAFEIMQNGNAYLYGVGGYDGTNPAAATPINQLIGQGGSSAIVVEGAWRGNVFEPSVSSPSWSDVKDAFLLGSTILLKNASNSCTVIGYYNDPEGEGQFLYGVNPLSMSEDNPFQWANPDL